MFDELQEKKDDKNLVQENKKINKNNLEKYQKIYQPIKKEEGKIKSKERVHEEPEDMFSFIDKDKEHISNISNLSKNIQQEYNEHKNKSAKGGLILKLPGFFAIDSLVKFLIYVIIALIIIGGFSMWIANILTIDF